MPSTDAFRIEFDRPNATYSPGEFVKGIIVIDLKKPTTIRALKFLVKGEAFVAWSSNFPPQDMRKGTLICVDFFNRQTYMNTMYILIGSTWRSRFVLPVGCNTYPFKFQLPPNIPSTLEHAYGYIKYKVKAVIDMPWLFDRECKAPFTVAAKMDLNNHLEKCMPQLEEFTENFYNFFLVKQGKLELSMHVSAGGYVPGQLARTIVNFRNSAQSIDVTSISVKLIQLMTFHGKNGLSDKEKEAKTIIEEKVIPGPFEKQGETITEFEIPPLPPSLLDECEIIDIAYEMQTTVLLTGSRKEKFSIPILIGTIPPRSIPSESSVTTDAPTTSIQFDQQQEESLLTSESSLPS